MVVSAEKARQKAEARRQRILAKSAERMDVVNGLAPSKGDDRNDNAAATNGVAELKIGVSSNGAVVESDAENESVATTAVENDNISMNSSNSSNKGARRMAAMRRRRYQAKKKEDESTANDDDEKENIVDEAITIDGMNNDAEKESTEPPLVDDDTCSVKSKQHPPSSSMTEPTKKKYMGVARMRRKINKEKKAQRIAELEATSSNTIDAAATMATIGMTASMVREGSVSVGEGDLSDVAIQSIRGKRKWWRVLFPPMPLVPRLVTLALLFMAGLDVGLEPHRKNSSNSSSSSAAGTLGNESLIYHVESSFTKPWEYGMGGKAMHLMGKTESAPPTSMPTSFSREGFCVSVDKDCDGLSGGKEKKRNVKAKLMSSNDEFGASGTTRPKGVSISSEFDDDDVVGTETYSPPVIDPIFRVDLDTLLQNSQLPAPINFAAKFAIGFHRMWVNYLWTKPTSALKSILFSPKTLVSSWTANPPIFLFISLIIRVIVKVLIGSTSVNADGDGADGKKADNLDILGKIKDTALNYATSSFPKTILVLKTLKEVVTVDMYVILCGLLVGLVSPLVKNDLGLGMSGKVLGDGEL